MTMLYPSLSSRGPVRVVCQYKHHVLICPLREVKQPSEQLSVQCVPQKKHRRLGGLGASGTDLPVGGDQDEELEFMMMYLAKSDEDDDADEPRAVH
eukprot:1485885-Rhodomonas_salina.3